MPCRQPPVSAPSHPLTRVMLTTGRTYASTTPLPKTRSPHASPNSQARQQCSVRWTPVRPRSLLAISAPGAGIRVTVRRRPSKSKRWTLPLSVKASHGPLLFMVRVSIVSVRESSSALSETCAALWRRGWRHEDRPGIRRPRPDASSMSPWSHRACMVHDAARIPQPQFTSRPLPGCRYGAHS